MTVTDSDRILAAGAPIKLAGGEARLRFDFAALKKLEDHFGSLAAAVEALNTILNASMKHSEKAIVADLEVFLAAGGLEQPETGSVLDLLDVSGGLGAAMLEASTACVNAWIEAFPAARAEGNAQAAANGSDGQTSSSSPPPAADDLKSSSGE